jgi:hypothetical protein
VANGCFISLNGKSSEKPWQKRGLTSLTDVFSGGDHPLKLGAKRREWGKDP